MTSVQETRPEGLRQRMIRRLRLGLGVQHGFTLIELLVVIIIIAVLSAIAIPTFLGQREHAHDAAAYSLVRNALTTIQAAFVDTGDYTKITDTVLNDMEQSIHFIEASGSIVTVSPADIADTVAADARDQEVAFFASSTHTIEIACRSESGNLFGIEVDSLDVTNTGYVKVKVVEGTGKLGW
jgi:prepilin-type N-terminal cleavage/methylation domain-containing protein